jgi:hypothetical protein
MARGWKMIRFRFAGSRERRKYPSFHTVVCSKGRLKTPQTPEPDRETERQGMKMEINGQDEKKHNHPLTLAF